MTNTIIYYLQYELDENGKVIIKNELFDEMLADIMNRQCELKLTLIDPFGIANSKIDDIVNEFIRDCKDKDSGRYCPYDHHDDYFFFPSVFKSFVEGLIEAPKLSYMDNFDVFNNQAGIYFKAYIPDEYVSEHKKEEFLALGPDDLMAAFPQEVMIRYILPRFYYCLYSMDRLSEKSDDTNLLKYKTGLH